MPLPLQLLKATAGHPMLVELKSGESYNGHLKSCDDYMNLHLVEAVRTTACGERFFKMAECFIRGSTVRYMRVPEQRMAAAEEAAAKAKKKAKPKKRTRPDDKPGTQTKKTKGA